MKQIIVLLGFMLLGVSAYSQQKIVLKDFTFGYYSQGSSGKALDYDQFVAGSKNEAILPNPDTYTNTLTATQLSQQGLSFGFEFNLVDEEKSSLPHFFSLQFRNGFMRGQQRGTDYNKPLKLSPDAESDPNESSLIDMQYRAENFGIGIGYSYRLLNKKMLKAYAGIGTRIDVPISSKMESNQEPLANADTAIIHSYFMDQKTSFFVMPKLAADVQVTKNLAIGMVYRMGIGWHPIAGTLLTTRTSVFEIGLKFNLK